MTAVDLADLTRRVQEAELRLQQDRARRLESVPFEARLWLAVVPAWSLPLAAAAHFPHDERGLLATLQTLTDEALCEWEHDPLGERDPERCRFWMPAKARTAVLREMLRDAAGRSTDVAEIIGEVGRRIHAATIDPEDIPDVVRRWAALARFAPNTEAIGRELEHRITDCLRPAGDAPTRDGPRPDEAMSWIEAARPLDEVLGEGVSAAIRLQSRRIDLIYRQRDDQRQLERFMLRDEPAAAFRRLVESNDDTRWALHFVGAGGVGKTMLLRYISGRWAAQQQAVTARIDFDYINPEFPARAPALLLAHLMQDLRLHAGAAADRTFGSFESKMLALHERARAALTSGAGVTQAEIDDVVSVFAEAVDMLPRPVVLLLDTCEELAKVRVGGGELPEAVAATLDILEAVHGRVPSVRVVFCGRRPLASAGDGWTLPGNAYPARSYLALHELRGFTRDEGRTYLSRQSSGVRADLVEPILDASVDDSAPMGFVRSTPGPTPEPRRYAPFDLSLYARWAREDRTLAKEAILGGNLDPYIETRVVGRIVRPALRELLPIIALAGRFERQLLRAASNRSDGEFEEAIRELSEHDWVVAEQGGFFEVKRHLRKRLLAYLRRSGRTMVSIMRARVTDHLVRVTETAPLEAMTISHFEAAVRLLEGDHARAFAWWSRIEDRFANGGDLKWAQQLVEALLADTAAETTDAAAPPVVSIRPAILATYASVLMHSGAITQLGSIWHEVERNAAMDPRPDGARLLALRAAAGQVAVACRAAAPVPPATMTTLIHDAEQALTRPLDDRVAAPLVSAFEALVETRELGASTTEGLWIEPLARFAEAAQQATVAPEIRAFAAALRARAAGLEGWAKPARQAWKTALSAAKAVSGRTRQRWLDWRAPDDVSARVRLEFARAASPALYTVRDARRKVGTDIPTTVSIDADRLASALLRLRGADRPPVIANLRDLAYSESTNVVERCNAHRAVQPLLAAYSVAEALGYGQVDAAVDDLRARFARAEQSGTELESAEALELARLRIARRMRLRDEERVSDSLARLGSDTAYATELHALAAFDAGSGPETRVPVHGAPASGTSPADIAAWLHLFWRSVPAVARDSAQWASSWAANAPYRELLSTPSLESVMCRLDVIEANAVADRFQLAAPFPEFVDRRAAIIEAERAAGRWMRAHPLERETHLRLHLRLGALGFRKGSSRSQVELLGNHMGWRLAADVALDEGELLALRLPAEAEWILGVASVWFARAMDPVAALIVATCRALAAVRAGHRGRVASALKVARKHLERVSAGIVEDTGPQGRTRKVAGFPAWSQVASIAREPTTASLDSLAPLGWRPWLVRLIAAKAWKKDGHAIGERSAIIAAWLMARYATIPASAAGVVRTAVLPPELAPWAPRVEPDAAPQAAPSRGAPPSPTPPPPAPPQPRSVDRSIDTAVTRVEVVVRSTETRRVPPRAKASVSLTIGIEADGTHEPSITIEGVCHGQLDYEKAADSLSEHSQILPDRWGAGRSLVVLSVGPAVAAMGWEGILGTWLGGWRTERPLRVVRRAPVTRGLGHPGSRNASRLLSIVGDVSLGHAVANAWNEVQDPSRSTSVTGIAGPPNDSMASPGVVHIVGAPIETGYGDAALQIARSTGGGQTIVYSSNVAERGGQLVRMRDLRHWFPMTDVFLLQANPIAGAIRGPTDQECAGFLRVMAAELAELGASVALTIPPLPVRDSMRCLARIGRAVTGGEASSMESLLAAVDDARRVILDEGTLQLGDRAAAASDFCIYLKSVTLRP